MKLIFANTLNMIKLNTVYKAGKQEVKFQEKEPGIIYSEYGNETVEGKMEGNTLKGIFHNKKVNVTGIMELTFHETGFEGRWKKGIEPGELKQKWNAVLVEVKNSTIESKNGYHIFEDEDNIRYEGEWENDEFISGKAEYVDEDGEKVIEEGIFEQGNLKEGKITWSDGNTASGTFDEELELNGKGIYTWENGDFQDGTWVHGEFKDGKAKITHDDGEISEGMMKDGVWVVDEEIDEEKSMIKIVPKIPSSSNLSNLFIQGNFEAVCFHADLSFDYSNKVLDKIIVSAMKTNNSELFSSCKATIDKFRWDWWTKKGNGDFHTKWKKYFKENLNLLNSGNKNELKSEIEFNQTSQKLFVDHEINLIGSQDRPEKSPIRSLAANMNKLFDKQDYEGVCIYADLSREYPNDIFDKILISAVKTLNNQMFNDCKSKFDDRDTLSDLDETKYKVKWLLFFDENKKLLNKNNEIKLFNDLKKYENEIKEEILIVNTRLYKSKEFDSGEKYNGEMLNRKMDGKGIYTWPDGRKYDGECSNDKWHGNGIFTWSNGQWKQGAWENGVFICGKGFWILDNGDTYEGEYSQGGWNGTGKYIWATGDSYEGGFKDGKILGKTKHQLENEQKQREEDERRYSEEIARREQEQLRHNEEMAKREADELERKKVQEKKKVEEDELERKKAQEKKEKQEKEEKINNTSHNFKIKVKHYWAPNGELACSKCGILIGRWKNGGSRGCKGSHNVLLSTEVCKKCGKSRKEIEYHPECKND